jgi:DnaJ-class molecular chaperone
MVNPTGGGIATAEPGRVFLLRIHVYKTLHMKENLYPKKIEMPNGATKVVFRSRISEPACPVCNGKGERHDAKTGKLRPCVLCKGTGKGKWK